MAPQGDIDALNVFFVRTFASLVSWGLLAVLERLTGRAHNVSLIGASLLLAPSLGTPLSGTEVTVPNRVVLLRMHLTVGAVLTPAFYLTSRARLQGR